MGGESLQAVGIFEGIGGFSMGFEAAGIRPAAHVEINKHRQRVLAQRWPNLLIGDDIRDVPATAIPGRPDLFAGGFPCDDTSIAAPHRLGLRGARSGLYWPFQKLIGSYLTLVDATRPRWVVIENPPGLLNSHNGRDMDAVVGGLEELGYGWAYRTVDGRRVGSAQRRERVLVVGHLGGDPGPAWQVLGDPGSGAATRTPYRVASKRGPKALGGPQGDHGELVFRKSARPRAALSKGGYETWVPDTFSNTLTGFDGGMATRQTHLIVLPDGRVRTLTLTEWERLQGFPDGWTAIMPPSERYNALGDAMLVPMAYWLGRRLVAVHNSVPMIGVA